MTRPRTVYYRNNTGGCNLLSNEAAVNQSPEATQMVYIQNMDIYKEGGFSAQLGNVQLNTGVTDNTAVLGIGQYKSGTNTYIIYTKASGKAYVLAVTGGAEGAAIKTGLDTSAIPKFVEYNSKVIAFNGVDQPWSWNGTTAAALTGTPSAWTTTKPTTADVDGGRRIFAVAGSTVYYNALGNENDWTTSSDAGSFSNIFNDNTNIVTVTNYGAQVSFHSGKPAIYLLSGTSPATYAINRIASNRACVSKFGAATCADFQYFFSGDAILPVITTELGVVKLGKEYDISQKIKPFLNATETELPLTAVDQAQKSSVILLPYDLRNQLIAFFKTVGSTVYDMQGIYNLDNGSWLFRKATPATAAARVGDYIIIGTSDGRIIQEYSGKTLVSGTFQKRILTPFFDFGNPNNQKQLPRIYCVFKSNTNLNLTLNVYTDYESSVKYTQSITSTGISGSAYGTAMYGTSTYAASQIFPIAFPVNLQGKCFQFDLSSADSSVDFRIIYYAFEIEDLDAH